MITLKSDREIKYMQDAGRVVAQALDLIGDFIKPGVTTRELDDLIVDFLAKTGAKSAFKGYHGYPATICASVNEELVHGIPSGRVLQEGDICSVDFACFVNGYCSDAARTYPVGSISAEAQRLLDVTEESLYEGIKRAVAGARLTDISHAIQQHVEAAGFSVVRDYVGHGIGTKMHEPPQIPNFGPPGRGVKLRPGLTLALEPMVNMGSYEVRPLDDGWTVVTVDGSLCAHFEHSICITDSTALILTAN